MRHLRWLSWATVGFVFVLMVWGSMVSSTGSELACPQWPICHGTLFAPERHEILLEWGHRLLALISTILILVLGYLLLTELPKSERHLRRSARVFVTAVALQIILGTWTSLVGLSLTLSMVLLLTQLGVLSSALLVAVLSTWDDPVVRHPSEKIRRLAIAGFVGLILQVALGSLVRHDQAGLACPHFPGCAESFLPLPFTFETGVAFFHRWWGVAMLGLFIQLAIAAKRERSAMKVWIWTISSLSVLQVILGVVTVLTTLHTHVRTAHAALGYSLWALLFLTILRSGGLRVLWNG